MIFVFSSVLPAVFVALSAFFVYLATGSGDLPVWMLESFSLKKLISLILAANLFVVATFLYFTVFLPEKDRFWFSGTQLGAMLLVASVLNASVGLGVSEIVWDDFAFRASSSPEENLVSIVASCAFTLVCMLKYEKCR